MDGKIWIYLAITIVISLCLALINIYLAGIVFVTFLVLIMILAIMRDAQLLPDIRVSLEENAKEILIANNGTAPAKNIHIALVPKNIEMDLKELGIDATSRHKLGEMVEEAKAVVTWENPEGKKYSKTVRLSALEGDEDLLKPMFPIFDWK